jgi:CHASE3 domain sensor protein
MAELTTHTHVNAYLKNLCKIQKDMYDRLQVLKPLQSAYDREQEEILHLIEIEALNAAQRTKAMKRLVDLRRVRRETKQEIIDINNALKAFKMNVHTQLNYTTMLSYSISSELAKDILGVEEEKEGDGE